LTKTRVLRSLVPIATAATMMLVAPGFAAAQSLVYFVRHAERADGGAGAQPAGMSNAPADPSLSADGAARAQKLAAMLADAGIKAIFTTEFKRTQETAKPLAARLGLAVQSMTAKDTRALVAKVRSDHAGDIVLVIGHSNTVPDAIKAFGGPDVKIPDTDYTGIYVLAPASGTLTLIRY
jgi:broad specificity phosphatase PhoE